MRASFLWLRPWGPRESCPAVCQINPLFINSPDDIHRQERPSPSRRNRGRLGRNFRCQFSEKARGASRPPSSLAECLPTTRNLINCREWNWIRRGHETGPGGSQPLEPLGTRNGPRSLSKFGLVSENGFFLIARAGRWDKGQTIFTGRGPYRPDWSSS